MAFEALTSKEKDIVLRCMRATAAYIDDWEKHSRLNVEPRELQHVIGAWPEIDDASEDVKCIKRTISMRTQPQGIPESFSRASAT